MFPTHTEAKTWETGIYRTDTKLEPLKTVRQKPGGQPEITDAEEVGRGIASVKTVNFPFAS